MVTFECRSADGSLSLWLPSIGPVPEGSDNLPNLGIATRFATGASVRFAYRFHEPVDMWVEAFTGLPAIDRYNFRTFARTIKGDLFKMVAPNTGGVFRTVYLDEQDGMNAQWRRLRADLWAVTLKFIEPTSIVT